MTSARRTFCLALAVVLFLAVVLPEHGMVGAFDKSAKKKVRSERGGGQGGAKKKLPAARGGKGNKVEKKSKAAADAADDASSSANSKTNANTRTLTFALEHSVAPWGDDAFTSRGTVEVKISQRSKQVRVDSSQIRTSLTIAETRELRKLAKGRHFYRLRMPSRPGSDRKVVASIPACALFVAGFEETLWLHMDLSGNLVSFDYATTSQLSSHCSEQVLAASMQEQDDTIETQTSVVLARPRQAHRVPTRIVGKFNPPPGLEHLRKVSKEEKEKTEQPGFFRKCEFTILL
jgi:hypothetical protein